jgi:hypothetical protein
MATAKLLYSNIEGNLRTGFRQRWIEVYQVTGWTRPSASALDDYTTIFDADGLPVIGDPMRTAFTNPVTGQPLVLYYVEAAPRTVDPEDTVNITYTLQEDPTGRAIRVNQFSTHKMEAVWKDDSGGLVANMAGTPYIPGLQRARGIIRLEITKWYAVSDWYNTGFDITQYEDHLNDSDFQVQWIDGNGNSQETVVWPAGTVYLDDIRAPMVDEPYQHVQVSFMFLIDTLEDAGPWANTTSPPFGTFVGWCKRLPNMGPQYLKDGNKTQPLNTTDSAGNQIPVALLATDGSMLAASTDPTFVLYSDIPTADFSGLAAEFTNGGV